MANKDCKVELCEIYRAIKELWKKTVDMVTKSMLADPNNGIEDIYIDGKSVGIYESRYPDAMPMPDDVGGIPAGTTAGELRGSNLTEMMDDLLFPTIQPYIETPQSVRLNKVALEDYYEVGNLIMIELRSTFDRGLIKNGDETNGPPVVGESNNFKFDGSGMPTPIDDDDGFYTPSVIIDEGMNIWSVTVFYEEGTGDYHDSKGVDSTILDAERVAGTVRAESPSLEGIFPFLHGMSDQDLSTGGSAIYQQLNKVVKPKSNEVPLDISGNSKFIYFAYPKSYGFLSSIRDGNNFDVMGSFDLFEADVESVGLGQNYTETYNIYKTKSLTTVDPLQVYRIIF